jgi:hypothetical protein
MPTLVLTRDDLFELTGSRQRARQIAWLNEHAIPWRDGAARILVSRAAIERWLCGHDARPARGPNLAAVA